MEWSGVEWSGVSSSELEVAMLSHGSSGFGKQGASTLMLSIMSHTCWVIGALI